jgi:DNA-binding response OmpR family regulator
MGRDAGHTVLICDNEEPLRALVRAALDGSGYSIAEARDGDESVDLARELRPDLIVLDMMMPGRTGLEILAELHRVPQLASTPVIMLTARVQAADRAAAIQAGADRYLAKPFSPRELGSIAEALLARAFAPATVSSDSRDNVQGW